jgi:hypothetical protein
MKKFIGWVGGIAAAVISSVLIYYLTRPTPPPPAITFEGMVINGVENAPLKEAMVIFEIKGAASNNGPLHDFTDEHGSYRMDFSGLNKSTGIALHAKAKGFRDPAPILLASIENDNRHDFVLMPLPVATPAATPVTSPNPTHTPAATPLPVATPHPMVFSHPPAYVRKMTAPAIKIQFQK